LGTGQPIVFSHGWPLTADDWDAEMLFFGQHDYRVVAHDRRGMVALPRRGMVTRWIPIRTVWPLFEKLDLKNAIMVGHSTGGGEVARYLAATAPSVLPSLY
jgi:non-heme chloroperoxidase